MSDMEDQLRALVRYRLDQAHETLHEAMILQQESAWRGTQNRAYYAMFYALLALLATRQLSTSKHSGAIGLFDREFVKPGLFPRELSRVLHLAFNRRQSYDYGELIEIDEAGAFQTVQDAQRFITAIERLLKSEGYLPESETGEF